MSLFHRVGALLRERTHAREIRESLEHYRRVGGHDPEVKQAYADAGSFRAQLDRLFALGSAAETRSLQRIAEGVVSSTLMNRYYRAADYLSDIANDLESVTYFTGEPAGEAPLSDDLEPFQREAKLKVVRQAWLVPLKVASIETSILSHANVIGRQLPYSALQLFERRVARLFALVDESERTLVEQRVDGLIDQWNGSAGIRARYESPAHAIGTVIELLDGRKSPDGIDFVRRRRHDQPLRLSTVVPEERQHYLRASFAGWEPVA